MCHGIIRSEWLNYFSLLHQFWSNQVAAFLGISNATVNRPTSCSRWAIRSAASLDCFSVETNTDPTFSTTCCFHFESCCSLRLYRLKSWILYHNLGLGSGPNLGGQYNVKQRYDVSLENYSKASKHVDTIFWRII